MPEPGSQSGQLKKDKTSEPGERNEVEGEGTGRGATCSPPVEEFLQYTFALHRVYLCSLKQGCVAGGHTRRVVPPSRSRMPVMYCVARTVRRAVIGLRSSRSDR